MTELMTVFRAKSSGYSTVARATQAAGLALAVTIGATVITTITLPFASVTAEAQTVRKPATMEARLKAKVATAEKRLGADHPDLVPALVELATFYRYWRRFAEAETTLKRALAIQEKSLGADDPKIAATLGALAAVYRAQGRGGDAEAVATRARALGPKRGPAATAVEAKNGDAKEKSSLARRRDDDKAAPSPAEQSARGNAEPRDGEGAGRVAEEAAKPAAPAQPAPVAVAPAPPPPPPPAASAPSDTMAGEADRRMDDAHQREAAARDEVARKQAAEEGARRSEARAKYSAAPKAAARNGSAASTAPSTTGYGGGPPPPTPATRGLPVGSSSPAAAPDSAPAASMSTPPAAATEDSQPDYDVVPVFFGTDRKPEPDPTRLRYGAERARTLQIGHALVTVPAAHKVPQVERPWALTIPYWNITVWEQAEDPKLHFTIKEIATLSKPEFLRLAAERLGASKAFEKHAVVFVHGFNTTFDNALYRTAQIAYDLHFDGVPFLYSWPSAGDVTAYTSDRERAEQSKRFLREFLQVVVNETGAKAVSIIAHSMGNLPLLDVLKDLKNEKPNEVVISQVILAAPDVDRNAFEDLVVAFKGLAKGVTLYAASNDRALQISRNIWGEPRAGDVPADGPLVMADVDTIDVTAASTDSLSLNHSGYATNNALLNDIALVIRTGERPPHLRFPILKHLTTGKGDYWQYPGNQ